MDEPLTIEHDTAHDLVTICGIKYSGHIFRTLAICEPGTWLRFESRHDGVVTVTSVAPETEKIFDVIAGKGAVAGVP